MVPTIEQKDPLMTRREMLRSIGGAALAGGLSPRALGGELPDEVFAQTYLPTRVFADDGTVFPYNESPLEIHVSMEEWLLRSTLARSIIPLTRSTLARSIIPLTERIAERVKALFHRDMIARSPFEGDGNDTSPEASLDKASRDVSFLVHYMRILATQICAEGYEYLQNNSFHTTMTAKQQSNRLLLDCDLASHVALHIAKKHDMPLAGSESRGHMYVCLRDEDPHSLAFEMTEMRTEKFLTTHEHVRKEHGNVGEDACKLLGYHRPMTEKQIRGLVAGNILNEMRTLANRSNRIIVAQERVCERGEWMLREYGPHYYIVVNLIAAYGEAIDSMSTQSRVPHPLARVRAARCNALRKQYASILEAPFT